jgi:hypothetical protein
MGLLSDCIEGCLNLGLTGALPLADEEPQPTFRRGMPQEVLKVQPATACTVCTGEPPIVVVFCKVCQAYTDLVDQESCEGLPPELAGQASTLEVLSGEELDHEL